MSVPAACRTSMTSPGLARRRREQVEKVEPVIGSRALVRGHGVQGRGGGVGDGSADRDAVDVVEAVSGGDDPGRGDQRGGAGAVVEGAVRPRDVGHAQPHRERVLPQRDEGAVGDRRRGSSAEHDGEQDRDGQRRARQVRSAATGHPMASFLAIIGQVI